eukprot:3018767-Pleurochrysis_carterae.AAC.1
MLVDPFMPERLQQGIRCGLARPVRASLSDADPDVHLASRLTISRVVVSWHPEMQADQSSLSQSHRSSIRWKHVFLQWAAIYGRAEAQLPLIAVNLFDWWSVLSKIASEELTGSLEAVALGSLGRHEWQAASAGSSIDFEPLLVILHVPLDPTRESYISPHADLNSLNRTSTVEYCSLAANYAESGWAAALSLKTPVVFRVSSPSDTKSPLSARE